MPRPVWSFQKMSMRTKHVETWLTGLHHKCSVTYLEILGLHFLVSDSPCGNAWSTLDWSTLHVHKCTSTLYCEHCHIGTLYWTFCYFIPQYIYVTFLKRWIHKNTNHKNLPTFHYLSPDRQKNMFSLSSDTSSRWEQTSTVLSFVYGVNCRGPHFAHTFQYPRSSIIFIMALWPQSSCARSSWMGIRSYKYLATSFIIT